MVLGQISWNQTKLNFTQISTASSTFPCAVAESRKENSATGRVISGAGAAFHNVTFNVFPTPKPRMSLKRKKVAENDGALSQLSSLSLRASRLLLHNFLSEICIVLGIVCFRGCCSNGKWLCGCRKGVFIKQYLLRGGIIKRVCVCVCVCHTRVKVSQTTADVSRT